jgi:hypothetical protein
MAFSTCSVVPVARRDPGGLLAPMLECVQAQIGQVGGLRMVEDPEDAALVVELVVVDDLGGPHEAPSASRPDRASIGSSSARASPFSNASASASLALTAAARSHAHLEPVATHAPEDVRRHRPLLRDPHQALDVPRRHRDHDPGRRLAEEELVHSAPPRAASPPRRAAAGR